MRLKMTGMVEKDALIAAEAQIESLKAELRAKEEQIAQKEWQMKDLMREIGKTKSEHEAALAQMRDMVPRADFNKAQVLCCVCMYVCVCVTWCPELTLIRHRYFAVYVCMYVCMCVYA